MARYLDRADKLARLTRRERLVATRFGEGLTYKEIARALYVSPSTVRSHLAAVYKKLGVRNKAELINLVVDQGAIESPQAPATAGAQSPTADSHTVARGERRQLTVLVCDIPGFSELAVISIRNSCAIWSTSTMRPAGALSSISKVVSRSLWTRAHSPISAIRPRTRTTQSERFGPGCD